MSSPEQNNSSLDLCMNSGDALQDFDFESFLQPIENANDPPFDTTVGAGMMTPASSFPVPPPPPLYPATAGGQVEHTISQDRAQGLTAQDESNFRLLARQEPQLSQPGGVPQSAMFVDNNGSRDNNHALQDYQVQLLLCEQQNKRRLYMARQEQDNMQQVPVRPTHHPDTQRLAFGSPPGDSLTEDTRVETVNAPCSSANEHEISGSMNDSVQEDLTADNSGAEDEFVQVEPLGSLECATRGVDIEKKSHCSMDASKSAERTSHQVLDHSMEHSTKFSTDNSSSSADKACENKYRDTSNGTSGLTETTDGRLPSNPCLSGMADDSREYCILHRVICSSGHGECDERIYEDAPRKVTLEKEHHLAGDIFVPDMADYLDAHPSLLFIVFRDAHCQWGSRRNRRWTKNSRGKEHYGKEVIQVVSERLLSGIMELSKCARPNSAGFVPPPDYEDPSEPPESDREYSYMFLLHHRNELRMALSGGRRDIAALSDYLESTYETLFERCDELFSQGLVSKDTLGMLFCPNEILVSCGEPAPAAYMLRNWPLGGSEMSLGCWAWGYDGLRLQRKSHTLHVTGPPHGVIPITELAAYPLRYASAETKQRLLGTGKKFWELRHPSFVSYEGWDWNSERDYPPDSRCMIDYQTYRKFHSTSDAFFFSYFPKDPLDPWPDSLANTDTLTDDLTMLLPPDIHGFFLKEKRWIRLQVKNVRPVAWNKEAFDRLVLPTNTKELVKALVMVRTSDHGVQQGMGLAKRRDDMIAGKGSGLIMLLHGGPGTGKTLTAESVAELAEMPLYSVTCGDIGTSPEAVEKYLSTVLHLGKTWNCVLLLDEADVFLEERTLSDLERNSLVSVFLRVLEYYDGILILTSNRVGTFDEAFQSRIQVALHYPRLQAASRRTIWRNFFAMLRDDGEHADFPDLHRHVDELAAHEMNGRQIRNTLTTARQLALYRREALEWEHIDYAIKTAGDFHRYLQNVQGRRAVVQS